jgi:hypothetical protein
MGDDPEGGVVDAKLVVGDRQRLVALESAHPTLDDTAAAAAAGSRQAVVRANAPRAGKLAVPEPSVGERIPKEAPVLPADGTVDGRVEVYPGGMRAPYEDAELSMQLPRFESLAASSNPTYLFQPEQVVKPLFGRRPPSRHGSVVDTISLGVKGLT